MGDTAGMACILSMVDQKSGVLKISFLSEPDSLMQILRPFSTRAADFSSFGWVKLEIICNIKGARMKD